MIQNREIGLTRSEPDGRCGHGRAVAVNEPSFRSLPFGTRERGALVKVVAADHARRSS
jgi:hypothetical protein